MTTNLLAEAQEQLQELLRAALGRAVSSGTLLAEPIPAFQVEVPSDTNHGDFASNVAMVSARAFKQAPRKIAEAIKNELILDGSYFDSCEIAGPGFLNFFVSPKWFADTLVSVQENGDRYGRSSFGAGKKVLVEFVSANPTGPMHIGNARGGAIGDCLATTLDWAGFDIAREFYVNDAGNQINKFALSLDLRYQEIYQDGVEMPEDSYHGKDIVEHAQNFSALYGDRYINASEEDRRKALVDYALPLNIAGLEQDLLKYRITYDCWFRESVLHNNGDAAKVVDMLTEKGFTYLSEGATWFKATDFGADKDFVLVRSNGIFTYVVPDIAYHYNKLVTRGYDKAINVLGADHHGYIPRLKAALQALSVDPNRLDVVLMQMVRLIQNGETVKASKRSGKSITLVTLLDEVPIDAARFFFNLHEANSQMDFDLDLAVEKSSENPVYYVQYAHARICSILAKLKNEGIAIDNNVCDFTLLKESAERELIRHIAHLPNDIIDASKSYDPARITRYSVTLATLFHKFYNACHVNIEDKNLMNARLGLCKAVRTVLQNVLQILKIDAPESM